MVGGVEYILRREEDTTIYNCLDNCIFEKADSPPGPLFCFAAGDLEVVCDDAEGGEYDLHGGVVRLVQLVTIM